MNPPWIDLQQVFSPAQLTGLAEAVGEGVARLLREAVAPIMEKLRNGADQARRNPRTEYDRGEAAGLNVGAVALEMVLAAITPAALREAIEQLQRGSPADPGAPA
jgi:hypothetical protein